MLEKNIVFALGVPFLASSACGRLNALEAATDGGGAARPDVIGSEGSNVIEQSPDAAARIADTSSAILDVALPDSEAGGWEIGTADGGGAWDGGACREQVFTNAGMMFRLSFSPDGKLIGGQDSRTVHALRLSDGTSFQVPGPLYPCPAPISALTFFPDDETVALEWCGPQLGIFKQDGTAIDLGLVTAYAISPEGRLVASGDYATTGGLSLWNAADGTLDKHLLIPQGSTQRVAFSPAGTILASASSAETLDFWNVAAGTLRMTRGTDGPAMDMAFSADGRFIATLSDERVLELWALDGYAYIGSTTADAEAGEIDLTRDGKFVVTSGSSLAVYSTTDLGLAYRLSTEQTYSVAVAPDGMHVASTEAPDARLVLHCLR